MNSKRSHEGYLSIDHRFSPGVPEDVARQTGLDPKLMGEGRFLESATITCAHCAGVVVKNPMRVRERAYCAQCDKYLCDHCDARRHHPQYVHAGSEAMMDAAAEVVMKGGSGSVLDLLSKPKIYVP